MTGRSFTAFAVIGPPSTNEELIEQLGIWKIVK